MHFLALIIATLIPLVTLYIIYSLDLYRTGAFRIVLVCFVWGGLAFAAASFINRFIYNQGWIPLLQRLGMSETRSKLFIDGITVDFVRRYVAPVTEEILKALVLIYLVRRRNFTYFVDGAIYGFSVGIGFAIFENYQYILGNLGMGLGTALGRVLSANLIHASASALVGVALGLARFRRSLGHIFLLTLGLLLAMLLHSLFNNLVTRVTSGLLFLYSIVIGLGGAGLIVLLIRRGLSEEKTWIEETLGVADRVTSGEAKVVHRLEDVDEILTPLAERFGAEKAAQIEEFLVVQARLGILRKTLEKLNDDRMKKGVEQQMAELRTQMDQARRAVGAYSMLYLRHIFPEESSPLWGRLESLIKERAAARPVSGGANLWATLGQRTAKPAPADNNVNDSTSNKEN